MSTTYDSYSHAHGRDLNGNENEGNVNGSVDGGSHLQQQQQQQQQHHKEEQHRRKQQDQLDEKHQQHQRHRYAQEQQQQQQQHDSDEQHEQQQLQQTHNSPTSLSTAANLIRTLDSACMEMNTFAATAARDAEEARKNARAASEVARLYINGATLATEKTLLDPILLAARGGPAAAKSLSQSASTAAATTASTPSRSSPARPEKPPPPRLYAQHIQSDAQEQQMQQHSNYSEQQAHPKTTTPTTLDRLAHSHAEDVLALTLELERTRHLLETAEVAHEDTKSVLLQANARNAKLQEQIDNLVNDLETQRQTHGLTVDALEHDLERARERALAAEQDAQLALDLAKDNASNGQQLEIWLQRAMEEIDSLREHLVNATTASPKNNQTLLLQSAPHGHHVDNTHRVVRFAEHTTILNETAASTRPSRSLVAVGRQLLLQRSSSDPRRAHTVAATRSPRDSAERRRKLRRRIESLDDECEHVLDHHDAVSSSSSPSDKSPSPRQASYQQSSPRKVLGAAVQSLDVVRNTTNLLIESGVRLKLNGRWWNTNSNGARSRKHPSHLYHLTLETLARHYCTSVELLLERKQKDIMELETLCQLWEQGRASGKDGA